MAEEEPEDPGSTLVRSAKSALTFTEMAAFVHDLEARPLPRLLADLPGLLALPEAKFALVVMVLRRKTRPESPELTSLLARIDELRSRADDALVRDRCEQFLEASDERAGP